MIYNSYPSSIYRLKHGLYNFREIPISEIRNRDVIFAQTEIILRKKKRLKFIFSCLSIYTYMQVCSTPINSALQFVEVKGIELTQVLIQIYLIISYTYFQ